VIPFLVQVLFFLTPVIYPLSMVKHPYLQYVLVLSPVYAPIELFRYPMTGQLPDPVYMTCSIVSALVFVVMGLTYFQSTEEFFADLT
jgi:lipopolysaccharide transport system permease protein